MGNNQIALLSQAPQFDTPLESQGKALQIQSLMNQRQVQDMDMQQRQQAIADDASTRQVFSSTDSTEDRIKALYKVNPKAAQAFEKAQGDLSKDAASTGEIKAKTQTENLKAINMRMQQARDLLGNVGDKQSAATWVQGLYADPDIGKFLTQHVGPVEQALARIPDPQADPQGFNKWRMASQLSAEKLVETTMPKAGTRSLGNRSQTTMTDPITGKVTVTDNQAIGQSPDSVASNATQQRGQNMTDARARETLDAGKTQIIQSDNGPVLVNMRNGSGRTVMGPDGQPLPGVTKPLNDSQSKALLFGTRMQEADKILGQLASDGTTTSVPGSRAPVIGGIINALSPEKQQMLDQAKRDFMNAVLRRESGAAISSSEFDSADKQYFPQPGEGPKQLAQKARARQLAINGVLVEVPEKQRASITPKSAAARAPAVNTKGWVLHTDASGNKAYVSPDGKSFEEVK